MTNKSHLARCAPLAIAATLALGSTPLFAQDVAAPPAPAPVIVVPTVTAPPPPAPTIVVPDVPEAAAPSAAATAPAQPATRTVARPATTARAAAPRPAPAAAAPAADPVEAEVPVSEAAPAEITPVAAAPVEPPVAQPDPALAEDSRDTANTMAIVLGVLAALGLLVLGFFALRRKGPKRYAAATPVIDKPVVRREPRTELPAGTAAPEFPAGLASEKSVPLQPGVAYSGAAFAAAKPSGNLSHSGAAVALPREMPKSYEERDALIQRMADAAPDRANPFRSRRARLKRARLILASLGRDFKNADPWIDLSQYPSNWPELARRQSAAA